MPDDYLDCTHPIHPGMPMWPGEPRPSVRETIIETGAGRGVTQRIGLSGHTGTHVDAPAHFIEGGMTVDQIPLETLIGPASILDMTHKDRHDRISREDLERWGQKIAPGMRVILKTGWHRYFRPGLFYDGFPCLTLEAAEYMARKKPALLGMDTPSPSPLEDPGEAIHRTLLGAGIVLVESLAGLDLIPADQCHLIILVPPFAGLSGAPCRVVAVMERGASP